MKALKFDSGIYPQRALLKACYAFLNDYYFHLSQSDGMFLVEVTPKDGVIEEEEIAQALENELLAQTVRLSVSNRTHSIRELLMARAMASTIVDEENDFEVSDDEDPEEEVDLEEILQDWFKKA